TSSRAQSLHCACACSTSLAFTLCWINRQSCPVQLLLLMFDPSPAEFVPSQQRGPDIAVYRIPENPELCYEWSFKKLLTDRETGSYICCGCRSLKARDGAAYPAPLPMCKIKDGYFITDPCNPLRAHFCTPRSTPEVAMRRMVIKKCNDLREDTERRPTSAIVDELIGEVAAEGFEELSDAGKRVMVEKLSKMTEGSSKTLTRVFQWNMHKAQSPLTAGSKEENHLVCVLCDNEQQLSDLAPIPSKKVATVILFSCLARYNVIPLDVKTRYKNLFVARKRICKEHFIQALLFLGWEVELFCGKFPLDGLNDISERTFFGLLTNLRFYRNLVDSTLPIDKKDVREFFNEYMAEFRDEVAAKLTTTDTPECTLFLKANTKLILKNEQKEQPPISQGLSAEQLLSASGEHDAGPVDFFVPKLEAEDDLEEDLSLEQPSTSSSGDAVSGPAAVCAVCSALKPHSELRGTWKDAKKNMTLLACLLLRKYIDLKTAIHLYAEFRSSFQKLYCKVHFVDAAKYIEEELKKSPACYSDSRYPLSIPLELMHLLIEQSNLIEKEMILQERDITLFYSECLLKYHDGNDWIIKETSAPVQPKLQESDSTNRTRSSRKRFLESTDDQATIPAKIAITEPVVTEGRCLEKNKNRSLTCEVLSFCGICGNIEESKLCDTIDLTLRPAQKLILLTCLVLNPYCSKIDLEVAKSMLRETDRKTLVCKSHFVMAMLYMYEYVKEKWNHSSATFSGLGNVYKLDLFNHINTCAINLQKEANGVGCNIIEVGISTLEKFYNRNEAEYKLITRLKARNEVENGSVMDTVLHVISEANQVKKSVPVAKRIQDDSMPISKRRERELARDDISRKATPRRSHNVFKSIVVKQPWSIKHKRRNDFLCALIDCGLCGLRQYSVDVRQLPTKVGRVNVVLACLLKQDLVDEKAAKHIHRNGVRLNEYLCHEHFIHAGAYLGAAVRKLIGHVPKLGLCTLSMNILFDIVETLQEQLNKILDSISGPDVLVTQDVASFYTDYLHRYAENDEWEIIELPPPNMLNAAKGTQLLQEEDDLFSNDVDRDGVALPLKEENEKQASIIVRPETSGNVYSATANPSSQSKLTIQEKANVGPDKVIPIEENAVMVSYEAGPLQSNSNVGQKTNFESNKAYSPFCLDSNLEQEGNAEMDETSSSSQPELPIEQEIITDPGEAASSLMVNQNIEQETMELNEASSSSQIHPDIVTETNVEEQPKADYKTCSLCGAYGNKSEFLRASTKCRSQNIILLSCMLINGTCDLNQAKELLRRSRLELMPRSRLRYYEMCKWHFSIATSSILNEYKRLRGVEPSKWLHDVPAAQLIRLQDLIQTYAEKIDGRVRITHSEIREFSFLFEDFNEISSLKNNQEGLEEVDINHQSGVSGTVDCDVIHIFDESPAVKPQEDTVHDSIQSNNHEKRTASAVDEEQTVEPFHKEISAVTLLEQPILDVDNGASSESRSAETSSGQWNGITTDFRAIALFHFQRGFSVQTATSEIVTAFGYEVVTEHQMRGWYEEFREKSLQVASKVSKMDRKLMKALLKADPNRTVNELAEELGAPIDTIISCVLMSGIPQLVKKTPLTGRQRCERLQICSALITRQSREQDFMERIVTYGEIWLGPGENTMLGVWWTTCGVVHFFLLPAGYKLTPDLYIEQLNAMHKKLLAYKRYRTLISGGRGGLLMLHDNRLSYLSLSAIQALHQNGYEILTLPEICYDLLPTEYHFVKRIREYVEKQDCREDSQLASCIKTYFESDSVQFFVSGIHDLITRCKKCYSACGDYFR
ncbi:unnamed protein product, partial [Cylicocyclus nassatus]